MDTLLFFITVGGLIVYFDYRVRPLLAPLGPTFVCHFCGHRFPESEREQFGNYYYCKQHGKKRQKEAAPNGQQKPRPLAQAVKAVRELMPWEK